MTHLTEDGMNPMCENVIGKDDDFITLEEALDSDGKHFDCVDCHKKLTVGKRHSEPS